MKFTKFVFNSTYKKKFIEKKIYIYILSHLASCLKLMIEHMLKKEEKFMTK